MKAVAIPTASTAQSAVTTSSTTSITVSICDASEIHYGVIRWYEPVTGRWLSNDPIGISGGLNQYVFVDNNPVNMRDPLGLVAGVAYGSNEEAALEALKDAFQKAHSSGITAWTANEFGGTIYLHGGKYYHTEPKMGGWQNVPISWPEGVPDAYREDAECQGTFHVHTQPIPVNERFSDDDWIAFQRIAEVLGKGKLHWLGTPQGRVMKWDAAVGQQLRIGWSVTPQEFKPRGYLQQFLKK